MECNITKYFKKPVDSWACSGSVATHGQNAGRDTWNHALNEASELDLLDTTEKVSAFKDYIGGFGAWDLEEIEAWAHDELNALFIQLIAGDLRESEHLPDDGTPTEQEWADHANDENVLGSMFLGIDGEIYYYMGC